MKYNKYKNVIIISIAEEKMIIPILIITGEAKIIAQKV